MLAALMLAFAPVVWACWNVDGFIVKKGEDTELADGKVFLIGSTIELEMYTDVPSGEYTWTELWYWSTGAETKVSTNVLATAGEYTISCDMDIDFEVPDLPPETKSDSVSFYVITPKLTTDKNSLSLCTCSKANITLEIGSEVSNLSLEWSLTVENDDDDKPVRVSLEEASEGYGRVVKMEKNSGTGTITVTATIETDSGPIYKSVEVLVTSEGCSSCQQAGGVDSSLGSVDTKIYLGKTSGGELSGFLRIKSETVGPVLATPAGLEAVVLGNGEGVEVINYNSEIRQVLAPQGLFDVVTNSSTSYSVNFYELSQVGAKGTNGYYTVTGDPSKTITVTNPSGDPGDVDTLQVVQTVNGDSTTSEYHYDGSDWTLIEGNGLRTEILSMSINGDYKTKTRTVKNPDGSIASQIVERYFNFNLPDWDWGLVETTHGVGPDAISETIEYYTSTNAVDAGSYGMVKRRQSSDGSWQSYTYTTNGLVETQSRPWLDAGTNVIENDYTVSVDPAFDGLSLNGANPRIVTEKIIEGATETILGRTYYAYGTNVIGDAVEIVERACGTAAYGDPDNQRTITTTYSLKTGGTDFVGRLRSVVNDDGTMTSYDYAHGNYVTNANPALNSFSSSTNGTCLRTVITEGTEANPVGVAYRSLQTVTVEDELGGILQNEAYVYNGTGYERISWTVNYLDVKGRAVETISSDGSKTTTQWGCCGKEVETGATGVTYDYAYDALSRNDLVTKATDSGGLFTVYTLDAEGRQITSVIQSGGLSLVTSNKYDSLGRVIMTVDPAGLVSSNSYEDFGRTTVTVAPGGLTNRSERYVDGRAKAVHADDKLTTTYEYGVNPDGSQYTIVYNGPSGLTSLSWVKTTMDYLGRPLSKEASCFGGATITQIYEYNSKGQLIKTQAIGITPQPAATLYEYDELGQQYRSGLDRDGDETLDLGETDRIRESISYYEKTGVDWWSVSESFVYPEDGNATPVSAGKQKTRLTGLGIVAANGVLLSESKSTDIPGNETISTAEVDRDNKTVVQTVQFPDSTAEAVSISINGLLTSRTTKSGLMYTYGYDSLERQATVTDPRVGVSTTYYNDKGQVESVTDAADNITSYAYDPESGRCIAVTNAIDLVTRYEYDSKSQLRKIWGDTTYPISYQYDDFGRMIAMSTYRGGSGWSGTEWPAS
ncbi:hypothetical protein BVX97_03875, partial [bacterium E08(2017)]